jgi:pimeloyl-ACP methyl ester carboxylesterase
LQQRRTAIATATAPVRTPPVEACLAELLDHLGIARAHFAGRSLADLQGFIAEDPERIASLTLVCPAVLNPRRLATLGARLLVVTGDHGLGARRVRAVLPDLPEANGVVLEDYAGLTWADLAADQGEHIDTAMREFHQSREALPAVALPEQEAKPPAPRFRPRRAQSR